MVGVIEPAAAGIGERLVPVEQLVSVNRGHFSTEQAAVKVLYLAIRELIEPKTRSKTHVAPHWKAALNAFSIYFQDRITLK